MGDDSVYNVYGWARGGAILLGTATLDQTSFGAPAGFSTYGVAVAAGGVIGQVEWAKECVDIFLEPQPGVVIGCGRNAGGRLVKVGPLP